MNTDIQVSVIIVSYNTKELTINTIKSVIDKTENVDYEIIVVDNDSKDGSVEELKKTFQDKITIIEPKENLGFGRANNLGIKYAKGEYVFLLNPDTELINNAIKIFYDYMEQNKQVGICGGNLYDKNNNPEASYFMYKDNIFSYFFWRYTELFTNIISLINRNLNFIIILIILILLKTSDMFQVRICLLEKLLLLRPGILMKICLCMVMITIYVIELKIQDIKYNLYQKQKYIITAGNLKSF